MKLTNLLIVFATTTFFLGGCDPYYGPTLRNDYGYPVDVMIYYDDGRIEPFSWEPCLSASDGAVTKLEILKDGNTLRVFRKPELRLLNQEQTYRGEVWSLSETGLSLVDGESCNM